MKIMGLDYGAKTVGVALSDALLMTAQPKGEQDSQDAIAH